MDFHTNKSSTQMQSTRPWDLFVVQKKIYHTAHLTIKSLQAFTLERKIIVISEYPELCVSVNMYIIF